jgi:eukaryotic-like serine/threonine-protein kinase
VEERRQQLFDAYIHRMLGKQHRLTPLQYPKAKFMGWLIWLAQRMVQESQTVFLIEGMQPSWLPPRGRKLYCLSVGLIIELNGELNSELNEEIKIVEKLEWSWQKAKSALRFGLFFGLLFGLFFGLFFGLLVGLLFGLLVGLLFGLNPVEIKAETTTPNQGIWNSAKSFVFFQLGSGLLFGLFFGLLVGLLFGLSRGLFFGLLFGRRWLSRGLLFGLIGGLIGGLIVGLNKGGAACIQHFILRLILTRQGHIPWNYARFLDHAAERLFLQKVGGGYIFIHRLLLEHIAQLDPHTFTTENRSR